MLAEVPAEPEALDRVILPGQLSNGLPGAVRAAVVNEDDLEALGHTGEGRVKPIVESPQAALATVDGYDHAQFDLALVLAAERRPSPADGRRAPDSCLGRIMAAVHGRRRHEPSRMTEHGLSRDSGQRHRRMRSRPGKAHAAV